MTIKERIGMDGLCFLVIGDRVWAKGSTPTEAVKKATECDSPRAIRRHIMYLADQSTKVNQYGSIVHDERSPRPIELYVVIDGKQYPSGTVIEEV